MPTRIRSLLLFLLLGTTIAAQQIKNEPRFALEYLRPNALPTYMPVYETQPQRNFWQFFRPGITELLDKSGSPGARVPSFLRMNFWMDGNTVVIQGTAYFGDYDEHNLESLKPLPKRQFGPYSGHLYDDITLSGMADFGLTPITLRVVLFKPETSNLPAVSSFVPQLTVNATGQDRTSYEIAVRNVAASAVVSLSITTDIDHPGLGLYYYGKPLVAAGESRSFPVGCPIERVSASGAAAPMKPCQIYLQAAWFDDDNWQGDELSAATMLGTRLGARAQFQNVSAIIEHALAEEVDASVRLAHIRASAEALPQDDTSVAARVLERFHHLSDFGVRAVYGSVRSGMVRERDALLASLTKMQRQTPIPSLAAWWKDQNGPLSEW